MAISGIELKLKRVAANVKGKALADAMGVPPYHLSRIERKPDVDLETATAYMNALGTCGTVRKAA